MIGELINTAYTYDQGRVAINNSFSGNTNLNNLLLDGDFSGGTGGVIYSAGTDLYNIFLTSAGANDITRVQSGLNTYTGGTGNEPTVNISAATLAYLSATTISGGTIFSGASNIANLFVNTISEGENIAVAGTPTNRIIRLNGNININNVNFSGTGTGNIFSATTISGGTIYSGSTDLYDIFCTDCGTGFSGFSSSTGAFSIIENNGSGNLASDSYGYAGGNRAYSNNYGERSWSNGILGQCGTLAWYGSTTFAPSNQSEIYMDGGGLNKKFVIPLDTTYFVEFKIVARVIGGPADGDSAAWISDGIVKNIGGTVSVPIDVGGFYFGLTAKVLDTSFLSSSVIISAETATSALTVTVIGPNDNTDWYAQAYYTKVK